MFTALLVLGLHTREICRIGLPDGEVTTIVANAGANPDGIALVDDTIYWTTMGRPTLLGELPPVSQAGREAMLDFTARNGGIGVADVTGANQRELLAPGALTTGKQLAIGAGRLYWSDREGQRVSTARLDGSDLHDLIVNDTGDPDLDQCVGVAVDTANSRLYWTQKGPPDGGCGRILRAALTIPDGESAARRSDIEVLWDLLPEPIDTEIVGDWLYWTDRGAPPSGNTLNRARLPEPGERGGEIEILADGFAEAVGLAVDAEMGLAYVSDLGGHVRVVPLPDGPRAGEPATELVSLNTPLGGLLGVRH